MIYKILFIFIGIGLAGFFKVCKFTHVLPQIVQIAVVALLLYMNIKIPVYVLVILIFPYYFMYLGYREVFNELSHILNMMNRNRK